jgi:hypothetical protein
VNPVSKNQRIRVQFDFTKEAHDRLRKIRDMSDACSHAEVVRNALRLYEWYLDQHVKGYKLQLKNEDSVKEVEILF